MSAGAIDNATAAKLRHIIGRVERIDEQIAGLNEDKSEVYQEAKSFGLDVKAVKALVAKRRKVSKDPAAFTELEAVVELYEAALESRPSRARTRETPHDAETGEVLGDAPAPTPSRDTAGAPRGVSERERGTAAADNRPSPDEVPATNSGPALDRAQPSSLSDDTASGCAALPDAERTPGQRVTGGERPAAIARQPLRTLPPRIPEPAPEMLDLPAFLDRRNERSEAAE